LIGNCDITQRCILYFAFSLLTDTAVPLSHAEEGLLRGENCTGQLIIETLWFLWERNIRTVTVCEADSALLLNIFVQKNKEPL